MQSSLKKDDASGAKSEFWGICCESGKRYSQVVGKKYHISMAALDPTDTMTSPCVSLMLERDGCQYLLCSLKPDSILQVILNLYFDKGENITFFLRGHGTVHLSGYYICDETDASNANSARKGEINALAKKGGKKPQTSFTVSEDIELESSDDDESSDVEESLAVKGKGISPIKKVVPSLVPSKQNKNQKVISKKDDTSDDETSDDDDSEDEDEDTGKDGELLKTYATKRVHSTMESEEEEESSSDEDDSSDSELQKAGIIKQQFPNKKFKADASTPAQNSKAVLKTPNKSAVVVLDPQTGKPDMNSSIGRTPMPKKPASASVQKTSPIDSFLAKMKNQSKSPKKDSSDSEVDTSAIQTPDKKPLTNDKLDTSAQGESAKKKKRNKKKKAKAAADESQETANKSPANKPQFSHKLPSGIEFDDIRIGNGLPAKKGKMIHVYYTGKLENNKVFDSCQQGSKPFSFKLAAGQVIKGWDLGIEGMKVGGKRKLKIPANLAYGKQRMGDIPPNSTLNFVVELKAVS